MASKSKKDEPIEPAESEAVPGELVESDVAGTGDAVNEDTGEVTSEGEQLPEIEQAEGDPLDPAQDPEDAAAGSGDDPEVGEQSEEADEAEVAPSADEDPDVAGTSILAGPSHHDLNPAYRPEG